MMGWNHGKGIAPKPSRGMRSVKVSMMGFGIEERSELVAKLVAQGITDADTYVLSNAIPADAGENEVIQVWKLVDPIEEVEGDTDTLFQRAMRRAHEFREIKDETRKRRHILLRQPQIINSPNIPSTDSLREFFLVLDSIEEIANACSCHMRRKVLVP